MAGLQQQQSLITALQDDVLALSMTCRDAVGVLQQDAPPRPPQQQQLPAPSPQQQQQAQLEFARLKAKEIALIVQTIDQKVDQLPQIADSEPRQVERLRQLQELNDAEGEQLREVVVRTDKWLAQVRALFQQISEEHLASVVAGQK
eukprot:TRINITY_DN4295_c0_g1_i1.p4 TRINITY_DN4295_c0_g1~~TRINITY_DN4295_c0_g1_i1.p4  ORF type:complete len:154 (-),score=79.20 TRINITY_DN4295_c0_g1_i1:70-507(-)